MSYRGSISICLQLKVLSLFFSLGGGEQPGRLFFSCAKRAIQQLSEIRIFFFFCSTYGVILHYTSVLLHSG